VAPTDDVGAVRDEVVHVAETTPPADVTGGADVPLHPGIGIAVTLPVGVYVKLTVPLGALEPGDEAVTTACSFTGTSTVGAVVRRYSASEVPTCVNWTEVEAGVAMVKLLAVSV
jgi:hypothetical protein